MLNWAQSEVFNWAPAEYSIMIKLKGSPYYHDYVDQGTILDRVVGSSRVRNIENISVPLELTCFFGSKTLGLFPFFEQKFHFLDQMVLFSRSGLPKSHFAPFWQLSDLEKGPLDLRIENFAFRNETSLASFSTSEQVHSRGTEHIF